VEVVSVLRETAVQTKERKKARGRRRRSLSCMLYADYALATVLLASKRAFHLPYSPFLHSFIPFLHPFFYNWHIALEQLTSTKEYYSSPCLVSPPSNIFFFFRN